MANNIIVRNVPKAQRQSLKRIARQFPVKVSVNSILLMLIEERTAAEIQQYKNINHEKKRKANAKYV